MTWIGRSLAGRVAVVAGATRGAGRGVARGLGEAGAIVYCTGRSTAGNPSPYRRAETIEETAGLVERLGGTGIAVRVDHTVEAEVEALFERIDRDHGRVDVLVNSVAGEDPTFQWNKPFWETDVAGSIGLLRQAYFSHLITAKHAARRMIGRRDGLIVEVTDRDSFGYGRMGFNHDLVKSSVMRLGYVMAEELRRHAVTSISILPGYLRSEAMLQHWGVTEATWRDAGSKDPLFLGSESPLYLGRAIAAVAADPDKARWSGEHLSSGEVAKHYGVTDSDGRQPDIIEYFSRHLPPDYFGPGELERGIEWHQRVVERARRWLPAGQPRGKKPTAGASRRRATSDITPSGAPRRRRS